MNLRNLDLDISNDYNSNRFDTDRFDKLNLTMNYQSEQVARGSLRLLGT